MDPYDDNPTGRRHRRYSDEHFDDDRDWTASDAPYERDRYQRGAHDRSPYGDNRYERTTHEAYDDQDRRYEQSRYEQSRYEQSRYERGAHHRPPHPDEPQGYEQSGRHEPSGYEQSGRQGYYEQGQRYGRTRGPYGPDDDRPASGRYGWGQLRPPGPPLGRAQVPEPPRAPTGPGRVARLPTPLQPAGRFAATQLRSGRDALRRIFPNTPPPASGGAAAGGSPASRRPFSLKRFALRRQRTLIAFFAVFIILTGAGVLGGAYFVDGVKTSSELNFPETTTVYYSDGSVLAKLGEVTRYELKYGEMNDPVLKSIVASEDKTFWTNDGVDFSGVMRAAWNNFTGGDTQGASTITQQYARLAFDLEGVTYQRKAREAVLAWKISDNMDKATILESYLNSVPFGRQTYGIEAAAQAFFGKTAKKTAPLEQQLTWAEAMVLVAMVKQPNPDPDDPKGKPGYDPTISPEAEANARERWDYVRRQLVEMGSLNQDKANQLTFPKEQVRPYNPNAGNGLEKPAGIVVNHVFSELTHTGTSPWNGYKDWKSIRDGGYQIYTTLNRGAQGAAEAAANEKVNGSGMFGQPANLQAALVAVQPGTGRVLAYYGGQDAKGNDYGGFYYDENNVATGVGRFPPGSSFKVYTLAAALKANISLKSYWDWNPHDMSGRTGQNQIRNASTCGDLKEGDPTPCTLLQSTISSLNVPYYAVTLSVSPVKVLQMARDAGIQYMWTNERERQDLRNIQNMSQVVPSKFDTVLGIGQYSVTVLDHANGLATFAAEGRPATAHFVASVKKGDKTYYSETLPTNNKPIISQANSNDLTYALSQVGSSKVNIGWDTAGKTGTWEFSQQSNENAHAWMVGYSKRIAAAVWVGNKAEEHPLLDKANKTVYGSGVPADIWRKFMTAATKAMNEPKTNTKFKAPTYSGNVMPDGAVPGPNDHRNGGDQRGPGGGIFTPPTRRQNN